MRVGTAMRFILSAMVLLAIAGAPTVAPTGPNPTVVAVNTQYVPPIIVVPVGQAVDFTNPTSLTHTWTTADTLDAALDRQGNDLADTNCVVDGEPGEDSDPGTCSVTLSSGETHTQTFAMPGEFAYFCIIHARMVGQVDVLLGP